jgi:hypothetical protein
MPDPQASLSPVCSGTPLPPITLKAAPSVKNHKASRVKPDMNDEEITPKSSIDLGYENLSKTVADYVCFFRV